LAEKADLGGKPRSGSPDHHGRPQGGEMGICLASKLELRSKNF